MMIPFRDFSLIAAMIGLTCGPNEPAAARTEPIALILALATSATVVAAPPDEAHLQFVRQLMDRQLYGLVEGHCVRQIQAARTPDSAAVWQTLLVSSLQRRSWTEPSESRQSLLRYAVDSITEFLSHNIVSPEADLQLRLLQVRSLLLLLEQEEILSRAGKLQGVIGPSGPAALPPAVSPAAHQAITTILDNCESLLNDLNHQLSQIQRDLDPPSVRGIRSESRLLLAAIALWRAKNSAEPDLKEEYLAAAENEASVLSRLSGDRDVSHNALCLLAEVCLERGDDQGAQLRIAALSGRASGIDERADAATLRVRHLLTIGDTAAATALLRDAASWFPPALRGRLPYFACEVALSEFVLLDRLSEPIRRSESARATREAFQLSLEAGSGLWNEAVQRAKSRFDRIEQLGVDTADVLEDIENRTANNDHQSAADVLDQFLRSSPRHLSAVGRGTLLARRGELAIALSDWDTARQLMTEAEELLRTSERPDLAAAASALKCFTLGRQWQYKSHDAAGRSVYESALNDHLRRYPDTPSARTVREWLILLERRTNPARAVASLLEQAGSRSTPAESCSDLAAAGQTVIELLLDQTQPDPRLNELVARYQKSVGGYIADISAVAPEITAQLRVDSTLISLMQDPGGTRDWEQLRATVAESVARLTPNQAAPPRQAQQLSTDALPEWRRSQAAVTLLICTARATLDSRQTTPIIETLTARPLAERVALLRILARQIDVAEVHRPGDVALASTMTTLLPIDEIQNLDTSSLKALLPAAAAAACVSGEIEFFRAVSGRLIQTPLSAAQLELIGQGLVRSRLEDDTHHQQYRSAVRDFWERIVARHQQGTPEWLEASLQLAFAEQAIGRTEAAQRIVRIIDVLQPGWGTPERLNRIRELRDTFNGAGP